MTLLPPTVPLPPHPPSYIPLASIGESQPGQGKPPQQGTQLVAARMAAGGVGGGGEGIVYKYVYICMYMAQRDVDHVGKGGKGGKTELSGGEPLPCADLVHGSQPAGPIYSHETPLPSGGE